MEGKDMNKNSNAYQIIYSSVMVILVGAALAFVYMALKPQQDENVANDKRMQILNAVNIATDDNTVKEKYEKYIVQDLLVDTLGNIVDSAKNCAFDINMKSNVKLADNERKLPLFKCKLDDGSIKYVIPVYGAGLWGPIWGYISVDENGNSIYGTDFSHEGETPGLGARITDQSFRDEFKGKALFKNNKFMSVVVMKKGQKPTNEGDYVDALTGATITSRGVSTMMENCLCHYDAFLKSLGGNKPQAPESK